MHRRLLVGAGVTVVSIVGYALALAAPYPGRALTLPGLMIGVTLMALGAAGEEG